MAVTVGTGCIDGDGDVAPARGLDDALADGPAFDAAERPVPGASCTATVERFAFEGGTCVARTTVRFTCERATQIEDWARVGVLCDGEVCAYDDVAYRCDGELARSFVIPCAATVLIGGATFDHPVTSEDASCMSVELL